MPHSLFELNSMSEQELRTLAESLDIKGTKKMDKAGLGYAILDQEALLESQKPATQPQPKAKKRGRPKKEEQKPAEKPVEQEPVNPEKKQPKKEEAAPKPEEENRPPKNVAASPRMHRQKPFLQNRNPSSSRTASSLSVIYLKISRTMSPRKLKPLPLPSRSPSPSLSRKRTTSPSNSPSPSSSPKLNSRAL